MSKTRHRHCSHVGRQLIAPWGGRHESNNPTDEDFIIDGDKCSGGKKEIHNDK